MKLVYLSLFTFLFIQDGFAVDHVGGRPTNNNVATKGDAGAACIKLLCDGNKPQSARNEALSKLEKRVKFIEAQLEFFKDVLKTHSPEILDALNREVQKP